MVQTRVFGGVSGLVAVLLFCCTFDTASAITPFNVVASDVFLLNCACFFSLAYDIPRWIFLKGSAIGCYECNSHNDPGCEADKPPEVYKTNCTEKYNETFILCRKATLHTDAGLGGNKEEAVRIIRSCGWDNATYANKCYRRAGASWQQMTCACSDDYCNGSPRASFTAAIMGLVLLPLFNIL